MRTGGNFPHKRRFASSCRSAFARAVSPNCAAARGSSKTSMIVVKGISGSRQEAPGGDTARAATSEEIKELRRWASALKEVVVLTLENRLLKSAIEAGEDGA